MTLKTLLKPTAPRATDGQDGPSCVMTAFCGKRQWTLVRHASRWWHVLRYYRKRQLAARLFRVGRRAIGRWAGAGGRPVSPRGPLSLREAPGLLRLAETRLRGRIAVAHEAVAPGGCARSVRDDQPRTLLTEHPTAAVNTMPDGETRTVLAEHPTAAARQRYAGRVFDGCFEFLNEERWLGNPVDWRLARSLDVPRLWRFHLHYHEFLLDAAAEGRSNLEFLGRAWALVLDWIDHNRLDDPDAMDAAWHPYCISRRLPVWIVLWSAVPPPGELAQRVLGSMAAQAAFLERNLEWDLRGNHLVENARALTLAGAFLAGPDADRWLSKGGRLFRTQIEEQVLAHGEHFERSPMYHARMLEAVLDVRDAAERVAPALSEFCAGEAETMAQFLESILHPDGEIPLLGDSAFGEAPPARILIERVWPAESVRDVPASALCRPLFRERDREEFPDQGRGTPNRESHGGRRVGDSWVFRDGGDFLLFDAGPVGPDHLPAHAHADLLTVEASIHGRRLFVDSGVFDYEDGPMRRYCRSTAAHDVLQLDGEDQCDMWSRFRMGYRGWPTELVCGETEGFSWARAEHNAYRRLGVPRVGRWLACRSGGPWFCVDWAEGTGAHQLTSWLHLHPDAQVQKTNDHEVAIDHHGRRLLLCFLASGEVSVESGWYCPHFGLRLPAPVVRWTATTALPAACGWSLSWGNGAGEAALTSNGNGKLVLVCRIGPRAVELRPLRDRERKGTSWQ